MDDLTASGEHPVLEMHLTPAEWAQVRLPPDDPWLLAAARQVIAFLEAHPERTHPTVAPFWLTDLEIAGALWNARGVGRLIVLPRGQPHRMHVAGKQTFCTADQALTSPAQVGRVCYVATWFRPTWRPYLVEVWSVAFECQDADARVWVHWRPEGPNPPPPRMVSDLDALPRGKHRAVVDAIRDILQGKPAGGRTPKPRDARFARDFERVIRELVIEWVGVQGLDTVRVQDVRTRLNQSEKQYLAALRRNGYEPDDVREWIKACVVDFRENAGRDPKGWTLPVRLTSLPRSFGN